MKQLCVIHVFWVPDSVGVRLLSWCPWNAKIKYFLPTCPKQGKCELTKSGPHEAVMCMHWGPHEAVCMHWEKKWSHLT